MTTYASRRNTPIRDIINDFLYWLEDAWLGIIAVLLFAAAAATIGIAIFFGVQNAINAPSSGTIHNMQYNPESVIPQQICSGSGTSTVCTTIYQDVPASWELDLYNKNGKHGWVDVTEATYNSHNIGDYIDLSGK